MTIHMWNEDETSIANLGFHVEYAEEIEERVCTQLSTITKRQKDKYQGFNVAATPFLVNKDGIQTAMKTYNLQC